MAGPPEDTTDPPPPVHPRPPEEGGRALARGGLVWSSSTEVNYGPPRGLVSANKMDKFRPNQVWSRCRGY